jgi:hypothetical protein
VTLWRSQTGNVIAVLIGVPSVTPGNVGLFAPHRTVKRARQARRQFHRRRVQVLNAATGELTRSECRPIRPIFGRGADRIQLCGPQARRSVAAQTARSIIPGWPAAVYILGAGSSKASAPDAPAFVRGEEALAPCYGDVAVLTCPLRRGLSNGGAPHGRSGSSSKGIHRPSLPLPSSRQAISARSAA